jgi:hypothetical protein
MSCACVLSVTSSTPRALSLRRSVDAALRSRRSLAVQGRRWLAITTRGGSAATCPGFGRALRSGRSGTDPRGPCRDLCPAVRGRCRPLRRSPPRTPGAASRLRSLRSEWVTAGAPVGTPLEAGSRPLARSARPERAGRHVEWAAGSSDWRLRSYSAVAPEDREGAGRRSSDRRPELVPGRPQGRAPRHRGNGEEGEPNQYGSTGFGRLRSPGEPQERSRSERRRPGRTCSVCEAFEEGP